MKTDNESLEGVGRQFIEHMQNPHNIGELEDSDGEARMTGMCGDSISVAIKMDGDVIKTIRVNPEGCAYTVVCASAMSELVSGKTLDYALMLEPEEVAQALGGLPEDHMHCARLAVNTLGEAIAEFYRIGQAASVEVGHADL